MARYFNTATDGFLGAKVGGTNFERTQPFSVSFWVNQASKSNGSLVGNLALSANNFTGWEIGTGGGNNDQPYFFLINNFGANNYLQTVGGGTGAYANTNAWYHNLLTYDGTSTAPSCNIYYVNGINIGSGNLFNSLSASTVNGLVPYIGNRRDLTATTLHARVADVAVWNAKLTQTEAIALYSGNARPNEIRPGNLVWFVPLDGFLSPAWDYSSYKNFGVLTPSGTLPSLAPGPTLVNTSIPISLLPPTTYFPTPPAPTIPPLGFTWAEY